MFKPLLFPVITLCSLFQVSQMHKLKKRRVESTDFRILGYSGSEVAGDKKRWEVLVILLVKK